MLSTGVWLGLQGKLDMLFSDNSEIINLTLGEAQDCLEQAKFECAFAKVDTVLDIDPDNVQAQRLYEEAHSIHRTIQKNISDAKTCLNLARFDCVITKAENILQLDPDNLHAKTLRHKAITQHEQYLKLTGALAEANECLETNNFECALSLSDIVLNLDPKRTSNPDTKGNCRKKRYNKYRVTTGKKLLEKIPIWLCSRTTKQSVWFGSG